MSRIKLTATLVLAALAGTASLAPASSDHYETVVVSSRPENVSGGDALVRLVAPHGEPWIALLNGHDITQEFRWRESSGAFMALLTGLRLGSNTLEIRAKGKAQARLQIQNHPRAGPIFSGPHQSPYICQTEANGLGLATDSDCNANPLVRYYYKSTEQPKPEDIKSAQAAMQVTPVTLAAGFKPFEPSAPFPADVARTKTTEGQTVNYIVRREMGVINRAVYDIQFLHQPGQPLPTPWVGPTPGWNGRLVYVFGGGCGAGYRQGILSPGMGQNSEIAQGYAVATSSLNILGNNCNDRVSAETLSMVKEHFIEQFGNPIHTIGLGGSGGAIQQYLIVQNYPGLLDGILPAGSFPDVTSIVPYQSDCALLNQAFNAAGQVWTEAQKTAVSGFATWRTCSLWLGKQIASVDPKQCDRSIPKTKVYDRVANPTGVRCDIYSNAIHSFGRDPKTGLAYRPLDNVGIQYGLNAFNNGKISVQQFLDLNESIGGYDEDGQIVSTRMNADPEGLRRAYQNGLILTGAGGLKETPIIDYVLWYSDDLADGHDHVRSLVTRSRLIAANGKSDNHVILVYPRPEILALLGSDSAGEYFEKLAERERMLMRQMDQWLDNIAADVAAGSSADKVSRNRPAGLVDSCWATDGDRIAEPATSDGPSRCNQIYPVHGDPRQAAGSPLTADVLKCALRPVRSADYSQPLTRAQLNRLKAIFPSGVCDYSQPGIGQTTHHIYKHETE